MRVDLWQMYSSWASHKHWTPENCKLDAGIWHLLVSARRPHMAAERARWNGLIWQRVIESLGCRVRQMDESAGQKTRSGRGRGEKTLFIFHCTILARTSTVTNHKTLSITFFLSILFIFTRRRRWCALFGRRWTSCRAPKKHWANSLPSALREADEKCKQSDDRRGRGTVCSHNSKLMSVRPRM